MTLHRFFVAPESISSTAISFAEDQSRQIRSVLRLRPGDEVIALDGSGDEIVVRLTAVDRVVVGEAKERRRNQAEPRVSLVLYQGLLKGAKLELVLQKGTEIGIARFVPVVTARSILGEIGAAKGRRYEAILREAAEQSRRGRIPDLATTLTWKDAVHEATRAGQVVVLWEDETTLHLMETPLQPDRTASLFVGPEGGLTPEEVDEARAEGAVVATLGHRILRAETAAIVGAALLLAKAGELG